MKRIVAAVVILSAVPVVAYGAGTKGAQFTRENGAPLTNNQQSETVGDYGGPVVLQDVHLLEKLARFDRERIPERVVHARGVGAYGEFVSSQDMSAYTKASLFKGKGQRTPVFTRFSTVVHPAGSPETLRDPRGFAVKFYTDQGNWDLVGNNLDVFFIRDAMKFPDMVHSLKPSPITNRQDPNRFFDFFSNQPESTNMLTTLYSDLGIPASFREMDGSSVHALKLVNGKGEAFYAKFAWKSQQGVVNLDTPEKVAEVQSREFSHATKDLYDHIEKKAFPKWELRAQIMPVAKVGSFKFNPLDPTKRWPEAEVPSVVFGMLTLNQVPPHFFQHTEQAAFAPSVMVPGIEPSEDKLLQGRLFSYPDTQRYRVGPNYQQLTVNAPRVEVHTTIQDGPMSFLLRSGDTNYEPSALAPHAPTAPAVPATPPEALHDAFTKEENFYQAGEFYRALAPEARARLVKNFAGDLGVVRSDTVRATIIGNLRQADKEYGEQVAALVRVP